MLPVLQVGPVAIPLPGLLLLLGVWVGLSLAERYAVRQGLQPEAIYNLAFLALVVGVLAARLGFVVRFWPAFQDSPLDIFSLNPGLFDGWSGVVGGVLAALIFGQRKGLPFWKTLDALSPSLAVMTIFKSLADLSSGAAFGAVADLPWSINLWGAERHPSQVYAGLAASLVLVFTWPGRTEAPFDRPGRRFLIFTSLSSVYTLFLEAFRGDSLVTGNGLRQVQVWAWVILALSLVLLTLSTRRKNNGPDLHQ
jgi:phosphatidylglycerol:prolipoprotein diacylglycerol transferase